MNTTLKGRTALVTGASSGLGICFATQLAECGADLVLTARREERLHELAGTLSARHGCRATVVPLDLAAPEGPARLLAATEGAGLAVDVLVNNAGFASLGDFLDVPLERASELLALNVAALTEITWRVGRAMRERKRGHILNVASFAAFTPVPHMAVYAASKAYVRNFTEAAALELAPHGVVLCALCPGAVATEFWDVANRGAAGSVSPSGAERPEVIVAAGLEALFAGRRLVLPRAKDAVNAFFLRLLPRGFVMKMAGREMEG
jgi:short-subunit dehydrogenase